MPDVPPSHRIPPGPGPAAGSLLVLGLVLLATGLGAFAVWFQWGQTRRCLAFLGAEHAGRIQSAARVEVWTLAARGGRVVATARRDVSRAAGLVHLRRGLVEDVNYRWVDGRAGASRRPSGPLPPSAWDVALAFDDGSAGGPRTILAIDLDGDGSVTVVGRPGRITLGPIQPGLRRWIEEPAAGLSR